MPSPRPPVVLPAARVPARRAPVRTVARPATGGGTAPTATATAPAAAAPATAAPAPVTPPAPPSVTRQITSGLADTTTAVTHQVGSTVGGPVGGAVQSRRADHDRRHQTLDDVGSVALRRPSSAWLDGGRALAIRRGRGQRAGRPSVSRAAPASRLATAPRPLRPQHSAAARRALTCNRSR